MTPAPEERVKPCPPLHQKLLPEHMCCPCADEEIDRLKAENEKAWCRYMEMSLESSRLLGLF